MDFSEPANPATGGGQTAFYGVPETVPLPLIERGEGVYFWDDTGSRYIDVSSGPVVSNIGHGNTRVAKAMAAQVEKLEYVFPRVARNPLNIEYTERLAQLAGPGFERVSLTSGGSEAIENAVKFLRRYAVATGQQSKSKIITLQPSYHGATIATLAMNGDDTMVPFLDGLATPSAHVPAPFSYRLPDNYDVQSYADYCADCLEMKIAELGAENVLAFMIEPVGGLSTGCIVPPDGYFRRIREICTRNGVFLIFDEILCGMGRTGKFLAAHHWPDALPDIVTLAKGQGAGYSPLGAVLAPARLVDELAALGGFEFQYSYNANPVSCAAGMAVLDVMEELDLVAAAERNGELLREGLHRLAANSPIIGDVRGKGMLYAVEVVADKTEKKLFPAELMPADRVRIHGLSNGLIIYSRPTAGGAFGHWFIVAPPLTITPGQIDDMLGAIERTLNDMVRDLRAEGAI